MFTKKKLAAAIGLLCLSLSCQLTYADANPDCNASGGLTSTECGVGASATADTSVALGAAAIGDQSVAAFDFSSAIGSGATTSRANQIALGTSTSTYTATGIASAASRATQTGALQLVTSDANGNLATDGGRLFTELDRQDKRNDVLAEGVAISLAAESPAVPANGSRLEDSSPFCYRTG
ncbi:MAG: hypothetical protein ACI831_001570 [Candidatus Azotimanducaceae bacterium]|jgi:hypothetical protein